MKTAWVFGGGGSKGAYEVGVWKALRELQEPVDLVCGTSIGAMIGTMVVQNQFAECEELWSRLTVDDVIANGVNLDLDIELLMSQKGKYKTIMQSYVEHKGADISPFEGMIHAMFDAERFFSSPIEFACMSVNVSTMEPHAFDKEEMKTMDPCDAILASASCFPAFPMRTIRQEKYIDGGYYDNVPIELARMKGAERIIAVDLKSVGTKQLHEPQQDVIYIEPYVSLGSFLYFDQERILRNMRLGYQDTMKKFGHALGYIYTFPKTDEAAIDRFELEFEQFCTSFSFTIDQPMLHHLYHSVLQHQLMESLKDVIVYEHPYLRILEMCAFVYGIDDIGMMTFQELQEQVKQRMEDYTPAYDKLFDQNQSEVQITALIKEFSQKDVIYYFYHRLFHEGEDRSKTLKVLALAMKDSFIMAILLYFIQIRQ